MLKLTRKLAGATLIAAASLLASVQASADTSTNPFSDSFSHVLDNASGDNGYLVLNTFALHFKNFADRNALTPGIGWEYSPTSAFGWHVGTLSDSFGYQAFYGGINYASRKVFYNKVRFLIGATVLHKQYHVDTDPETKLVPLPAVEYRMSKRTVLNISGSPQVDYAGQRSNAVMFFQLKINL